MGSHCHKNPKSDEKLFYTVTDQSTLLLQYPEKWKQARTNLLQCPLVQICVIRQGGTHFFQLASQTKFQEISGK